MALNNGQSNDINVIARYLGIPDWIDPDREAPSDKEAYEALARLTDSAYEKLGAGLSGRHIREHMERVTVA